MRKLGFGLIAASALVMSSVSTTPARADGGATAAWIVGTMVVATVACQPGYVLQGSALCVLSPFYWVGTAQAAPGGKGTIKVKAKKSSSKKSKKG